MVNTWAGRCGDILGDPWAEIPAHMCNLPEDHEGEHRCYCHAYSGASW